MADAAAPPTAAQPTAATMGDARSARLSLAFSCVGHFFSHFLPTLYFTAVLSLGPSFPTLSHGDLVALATLGTVLYGALAVPAGWLGDRWSGIGMMVIYFLG
ncbi:MAG: hypothetical protein JNK11_21240, partial [Alphaproteobacteria bacterium]|nr:hypothetical protein [Alphaproteobacteria bacterium]